jgi:hypothetical protein
MILRAELKSLQSHRAYPSVSILAPTHRTAPANKQDRIKVKNLLAKAIDRLHGEFTKREVAAVVNNLKTLVREVDWNHTLEGLALFASPKHSAAMNLPFRVKPRVSVDETYATRDLAYAFNRTPLYRVLVLSHESRLYDGWTTVLEEHRGKPFPLTHRGPGGATKLPGGQGVNRSAARDAAQRAYFKKVDEAVASVQQADPAPLLLAGVERNLAFFREVTSQAKSIVGMLAGNHDRTTPNALGKLVWPVFDAAETLRRTEALVTLDDAVSAGRHASGIDQVWRAAVDAKCRLLLVEKDFSYPADLSDDGYRLLKFTNKGPASLDDAVDEVIERVVNTGGEVFFYSPSDLEVHQKIAAVLRR